MRAVIVNVNFIYIYTALEKITTNMVTLVSDSEIDDKQK